MNKPQPPTSKAQTTHADLAHLTPIALIGNEGSAMAQSGLYARVKRFGCWVGGGQSNDGKYICMLNEYIAEAHERDQSFNVNRLAYLLGVQPSYVSALASGGKIPSFDLAYDISLIFTARLNLPIGINDIWRKSNKHYAVILARKAKALELLNKLDHALRNYNIKNRLKNGDHEKKSVVNHRLT